MKNKAPFIEVLIAHQLRPSNSLCSPNHPQKQPSIDFIVSVLNHLRLSNVAYNRGNRVEKHPTSHSTLKRVGAIERMLITNAVIKPKNIIDRVRRYRVALLLTLPLLLSSCGSPSDLSGAGATFPAPYYNMVFRGYTTETGHNVMYGAIGSGGGIRSLRDQTVDFGATDVFLSDKEMTSFSAEVVHIPTAMGAIVMSYNLKGVDTLRLTAELVSQIYRGEITVWNDPRIVALNGNTALPDRAIVPVYRSDGSGTTAVFSDYMSKVDEAWKSELGEGKALKFGFGVAAKGNPGVAGIIVESEGSIGYMGSEYASALGMKSAFLRNSAGLFVEANNASISAAADIEMPADTRVTITNSENPNAYPICTFTWLIAYREQGYNGRKIESARSLAQLFLFVISPEGQQMAQKTHYASLPKQAVDVVTRVVGSMTHQGVAIIESASDICEQEAMDSLQGRGGDAPPRER